MSELTRDAEEYLAQLDRALWPLSQGQRQAVLLELRSHFEDRLAEGRLHLLSTLEHMGPAEDIARAFVEAAGRRWYSRPENENNLPSVVVQPTALVPYRERRRWLPFAEMADSFRRTYEASRNGIWSIFAVLIAVLTATDFFIGIDRLSNGSDGMPMWLVMIVRSSTTTVALAAAYRALLTQDDLIWNFSASSAKFVAATLAMILNRAGSTGGIGL